MKMVEIRVDMEHRNKLRRLHTATHIINFCARKVLGNHIWQNGSNLRAEFGTLDITHFNNLTFDEIVAIEVLANEIVFENRKVTIEEFERTEAEQKYGFGLYQGGAIPMKKLRVVKILDSDIEACGGIHMLSTGGIGLIKIVETQKIQDGVVRLKYVVHDFALEYVQNKEFLIDELKGVFCVDETSLVRTSQKFFDEWKVQKKELERLKKELKESYMNSILSSDSEEFELQAEFDMGFLMELFTSVIDIKKKFRLISKKFIIATPEIEIKNYKKQISKGKFNIYVM